MGVESKAVSRLSMLFDDGKFTQLDSKADGSVVTACGNVYGVQCYAFSQDISVNDGAMSKAVANKIAKVYDLAEKTGNPIIGIYDSLGAKVEEGLGALEGYGMLISKANRLSGVVPQIAVVAGTCATSSAIWAMESDVVVMEKEGELFVTSPFVADDDNVGKVKTAVENGTAHISAEDDADAMEKVRYLLTLLPENNLSLSLEADAVAPSEGVADENSKLELRQGFGTDTKTYLARVRGNAVGVAEVNGILTEADCKKLTSLVGLCDAFSIPVVTVVDAEGFAEGEADGMVKCASNLVKAYAEATTVKVTLVTGKCYGPLYLAFASTQADLVYATENATVCAMKPETATLILNKDKMLEQGLEEATKEYDASALTAAQNGYITDVIDAKSASSVIGDALDMLATKRISTLDKKHTVLSF